MSKNIRKILRILKIVLSCNRWMIDFFLVCILDHIALTGMKFQKDRKANFGCRIGLVNCYVQVVHIFACSIFTWWPFIIEFDQRLPWRTIFSGLFIGEKRDEASILAWFFAKIWSTWSIEELLLLLISGSTLPFSFCRK